MGLLVISLKERESQVEEQKKRAVNK